MKYSSSLTDAEWELIKPLLPQKRRTRPLIWSKRQIWDGIFYQLKNGCNWGDLPKNLPPYSTGLSSMLEKNIDYFKDKPKDLPKITILLDQGYHLDKLTVALEKIYPETEAN